MHPASIDVIADARTEPNPEIFHPGDGSLLLRWSFLELVNHSSPTVSGNPNRLRVRKFANAGGAEFSAKAGTFHTPEWQTRIGRDHGVDKDHSGVQLGRKEFLFFAIASPGARPKAEYGVVREVDCLVNIAHAENSCDRAEDFFAVRGRVFGHIDQNGGLIEESRAL